MVATATSRRQASRFPKLDTKTGHGASHPHRQPDRPTAAVGAAPWPTPTARYVCAGTCDNAGHQGRSARRAKAAYQ